MLYGLTGVPFALPTIKASNFTQRPEDQLLIGAISYVIPGRIEDTALVVLLGSQYVCGSKEVARSRTY